MANLTSIDRIMIADFVPSDKKVPVGTHQLHTYKPAYAYNLTLASDTVILAHTHKNTHTNFLLNTYLTNKNRKRQLT